MVNVLVRDLPEGVHARLVAEAKERGQSLQQYLRSALVRLAVQPTPRSSGRELVEAMDRRRREAEAELGERYRIPTTQEIVDIIREMRGPLDPRDYDGPEGSGGAADDA